MLRYRELSSLCAFTTYFYQKFSLFSNNNNTSIHGTNMFVFLDIYIHHRNSLTSHHYLLVNISESSLFLPLKSMLFKKFFTIIFNMSIVHVHNNICDFFHDQLFDSHFNTQWFFWHLDHL